MIRAIFPVLACLLALVNADGQDSSVLISKAVSSNIDTKIQELLNQKHNQNVNNEKLFDKFDQDMQEQTLNFLTDYISFANAQEGKPPLSLSQEFMISYSLGTQLESMFNKVNSDFKRMYEENSNKLKQQMFLEAKQQI
mmetsp:Transcript_1107/g.2035  ORF Transcript_1107/g.2035 Transcript_1107/m.2035 type:complete len:139 (-) Transcript_1107:381-797(-)